MDTNKKFRKFKELSPINCENNEEMINLGLRPPSFVIDKNVFKKTNEERTKLNVLKRTDKLSSDKSMFRDIHRKPIGCLIVHIKNQDKLSNFKNTFNYKCAKHEIIDIMGAFHKKQIIVKQMFNGRTI